MSVCPLFACLSISTPLPLDGFLWILILETLWISVEKSQILLKSDKNMGHFTKKKDLSTFCSWWRHRFTINAFFCATYSIVTLLTLNNTQTTHCYSSTANMLPYTTLLTLFYEIFIYSPKCFGFTDIIKCINNLVRRFSSPLHLKNLVRY